MRIATIKAIIIVISLSLILGLLSVFVSEKYFKGFNNLTINNWHKLGMNDQKNPDPYKSLYYIWNGIIAPSKVEGLSYWLQSDQNGRPLQPNCTYKLHSSPIATEFFTIYTTDSNFHTIYNAQLPTALNSSDLVLDETGNFTILISKYPQSNNWLATLAEQPFYIILNLYNTPFVSPSGVTPLILPTVELLYCGTPNYA